MTVGEAVLVWKGFDFLNVSYDGTQVEELVMRQALDPGSHSDARFWSTLRRLKAERTQQETSLSSSVNWKRPIISSCLSRWNGSI
jgi:hypothetical protein